MNEEFLNIIEQYKVNKDLIDKIRIYILNHLYMTDDITQYVTLFSDTAKLIGDDVGYALSRGMLFWVYHGRDIELAHKYNQESLALYHKINDYSNKIGYLSILNNEFIYNNYTGTLHESYKVMCEAMQIAEENKNINYYFVYSINGIYLLLDLGLYDKALEIINKLEANNLYLSDSDKAIMKTLHIKINWYMRNKDICLKVVKELKEYNEAKHVLDDYIINAYMIEVLLINNNEEEAAQYVNDLICQIKDKSTLSDGIDLGEAYLALGRYYLAINNTKDAFKYYKLIYPSYNNLLGTKLNALNEALGVFFSYDKTLYYEALEAKEKLLDEINQTLVVVTKQDKKIYDEFSDFRYKFLFQKMQQLTAFIKDINNLEDSNALEKLIKDNLSQILGASFVELEIADENFKYKGLNLKQIDDLKIFNLNELKENLKGSCDSLACIKINETNLDGYLYILIGLKAMDALEQKEILYMLSLVKEVLSPVLLQFERYNEAMSNYRHDQLTHVYNRYGLDYIIKEQFNHANMLYLLMIDIDNFKHINDTYGHEAGDEILVKIASTLSNCLGNKNVARIGGEEFIGLIPSNNKDIKDKLDDIMNNVRSIKFQKETISISIGVSKMLSPNDFKEAKLEADRKLYVAKNSGKNKYIL